MVEQEPVEELTNAAEGGGTCSEGTDGSENNDGDEDVSDQLSALLVSLGEAPIDKRRLVVRRYSEDKMKSIESSTRKKLKLETSKVETEFKEMLHCLKEKFTTARRYSDSHHFATVLDHKESGG